MKVVHQHILPTVGQRFSPSLSQWEAWWHEGRHVAGEVAESSTY